MYRHAANSAAQPNSSLKAPGVAFGSCRERNEVYSMPSFDGAFTAMRRAAVGANFRRRDAVGDFGASGSLPPRIPSSARGHASGLSAALRHARSSASANHPTTQQPRVGDPGITPPSGLRFPSATDPP